MENLEKQLQIANARLHKAYLRTNNAKNYDMRSFEFWDKHTQYTKIKSLLLGLQFATLTNEEREAKAFIESQGVDRVENGVEFVKELLKS